MVHHKQLQGNVGEDGRKSAQQWRYRLHLMHTMEVSMVYSGLAVVLTIIVATAIHFGSVIRRTSSIIILKAKQLALEAALPV